MKETSLFLPIKKLLESLNYQVYSEVYVKQSNRYIDVIGICDQTQRIIAVELKTSYNQKLMQQGLFNANSFHLSYVAIPKPQRAVKYKLNPLVGLILVDTELGEVEIIHHPKAPAFLPSYEQMRERLYLNSINTIIQAGEGTSLGVSAKQITLGKVINILHLEGAQKPEELAQKVAGHWKNEVSSLLKACQEHPEIEVLEENGVKIIKLKTPKT